MEEIVKLAESVGYNKFNIQWFENNKIDPNTWFLECCLLQKWLREVHKLNVTSNREMLDDALDDEPFYFDNSKWIYSIDDLNITTEGISKMRGYNIDSPQFENYEEALEEGLKEALKLLINK